MSELNEKGKEVFDQTPVSCPIHFDRPEPLHLRIRRQIIQAMADMSQSTEYDTPEEADDFSMPDVPEFSSPYEMEDDFDHINQYSAQNENPKEQEKKDASSDKSSDLSAGPTSEPASEAG